MVNKYDVSLDSCLRYYNSFATHRLLFFGLLSLSSDTETLERGLLKLSLADSSVEVTATAKGERILACLGEIHLEQSILDLETVYCDKSIKLRISDLQCSRLHTM